MEGYYTDQNGCLRRYTPKVRMKKKQRIKLRWEGREHERFKTGRGHLATEVIEAVKDFLRASHPETVSAKDIGDYIGISSVRALRILDILSGSIHQSENSKFDFLVYETGKPRQTRYGIYLDRKTGVIPYEDCQYEVINE